MRREGRKSRGEGRVVPLSEAEGQGAGDAADPGPTPEFAAQVVDEFRSLLRRLGDDSLRSVALAKLEGYTNRQIAERLGCIEQTVERKLRSIRKIWSAEGEGDRERTDVGPDRRPVGLDVRRPRARLRPVRGRLAVGRRPSIEDYLADAAGPDRPIAAAGAARPRPRLPAPRRRAADARGVPRAGSRPTAEAVEAAFAAAGAADAGRASASAMAGDPPGRSRRSRATRCWRSWAAAAWGSSSRRRAERLNRLVALKMILAGDLAGPEAAARFLAEAEAVARLQHPQVVQIFRIGDHDGRPFLEMEYVEGGSLADRLDGRPWTPAAAARLVESLAGAVHHAHLRGIVHRDLKPANILLTADGMPKITDFGLAKSLGADGGLTRTDSIIGSPSYMAPEQAGGAVRRVGPATDVYSLGAILYELLTGRPAVPRGDGPRHARAGPLGRAGAPVAAPAGAADRPRDDRPEVPREGPRPAVSPAPRPWPTTSAGSAPASRSRPGRWGSSAGGRSGPGGGR